MVTTINGHDNCGLCARLAEGFTETRNGVWITPLHDECGFHHMPDAECLARFRCMECRELLPRSEQEWASSAIVRLAHGKTTRPRPTGVCSGCWPRSIRNAAYEPPEPVDDGSDPFAKLVK